MVVSVAEHAFTAGAFRNGSILAVDARSSRCFSRHSHEEFGVGLVTCGAQRSWSGRGMVEAGRGDLITVNPGEVHDGMPIGSDRAWSMLYFAPELVGSVMADLSEGKLATRELHAPVVTGACAARHFIALRAAAIEGDEPGQAFDERLILLFATLFAIEPPQPAAPPGQLTRARERIDDDPLAPHSLSDLASACRLSRFQTVRGFAKLTGLTPRAYVIQRRLEVARRAIRAGSMLVDAAVGAGFADQSHMHRAFVSRYGITPGAYANAFAH